MACNTFVHTLLKINGRNSNHIWMALLEDIGYLRWVINKTIALQNKWQGEKNYIAVSYWYNLLPLGRMFLQVCEFRERGCIHQKNRS